MISVRSLASILVPAGAAAIAFALLAPWLYPCIGASRFADCMDPKLITGSEVFNPEGWCYWGVCDWSPSALGTLARIVVVCMLLLAAGIVCARIAKSNKMALGVVTVAASLALAAGLIWYMYPWAAA